jgi:hypothetical protein
MKDLVNDLLFKVLKTPSVAEQIRKNLVNRDISLTIDGKEYKILNKLEKADDELGKLKIQNYDLTKQLGTLIDVIEQYDDAQITHTELLESATKAKTLLK